MNGVPSPTSHNPAQIERLYSLGPEAQGEIDDSLLRENLRLSVVERLEAAARHADAIEVLRVAVRNRRHE